MGFSHSLQGGGSGTEIEALTGARPGDSKAVTSGNRSQQPDLVGLTEADMFRLVNQKTFVKKLAQSD